MNLYARAPLVEAVLELRFTTQLTTRDLERLRQEFESTYPVVEERYEFSLNVTASGPKADSNLVGFHLKAGSGQDSVLLQHNALTTVRLAPYVGWDGILNAARANFETFLKILPRPTISRLGARYINRFDIPSKYVHQQSLSKYFSMGVDVGTDAIRSVRAFGFNFDGIEEKTGLPVRVGGNVAPPVLLEYDSFMLDIDVSCIEDIPLRIEDIWERFGMLRIAKNNIFEAAITDELRALIQ